MMITTTHKMKPKQTNTKNTIGIYGLCCDAVRKKSLSGIYVKTCMSVIEAYIRIVTDYLLDGGEVSAPGDKVALCIEKRGILDHDTVGFLSLNKVDIMNVYCIRSKSDFMKRDNYKFRSDSKLRERLRAKIDSGYRGYRHE